MTIKRLMEIVTENHIPEDVVIESDSGWECGPTRMDGVWYNKKLNKIIFTQSIAFEEYNDDPYWVALTED